MATLTEVVAAVVVQSSAMAFSHFGVTLETPVLEPRAQVVSARVVARSPRRVEKLSNCPETQRIQLNKA